MAPAAFMEHSLMPKRSLGGGMQAEPLHHYNTVGSGCNGAT